MQILGYKEDMAEETISQVRGYTEGTFCAMANSTIGKEVQKQVPSNTSCLAITFSLSELLNHLDLGLSALLHHIFYVY